MGEKGQSEYKKDIDEGENIGDGFIKNEFTEIIYKNNKVYSLDIEKSRTDKDLIELIESGHNCNTRYSNLEIIDIPDNVNWEIEEYDGMESIHEVHRSW